MDTNGLLAADNLGKTELFRDLPSDALDEVITRTRVREFSRGALIFNQGDPAGYAHVLIAGSVRISQSGRDGAQALMRFIKPGETFGTVALFTDRRYPADAFAVAPSLEASWSEDDLRGLMGRHLQIAMNVIRIIGRRLQEAQERVRELATQHAEQRIAHALLRLSRQAGKSTPEGIAIEFPLRRKDIADISGTTLYTASRILTAWQKAGLLRSRHQHLVICQPAELSRVADDAAGK
jgi:CRP-like cAMP-binding protein